MSYRSRPISSYVLPIYHSVSYIKEGVTACYNVNIISFKQFHRKSLLTMKSNEESSDLVRVHAPKPYSYYINRTKVVVVVVVVVVQVSSSRFV